MYCARDFKNSSFQAFYQVLKMEERLSENPRSDEMHKLMEEFRQLYKEKLQRLEDGAVGDSEDTIKVIKLMKVFPALLRFLVNRNGKKLLVSLQRMFSSCAFNSNELLCCILQNYF